MDETKSEKPFQGLGAELRALRERMHESIIEASGAVEIEAKELASIELGKKRPSEEILLLLISHFGAKDDEAVKLWELAGYAIEKVPSTHMVNDHDGSAKPGVMVMPADARIVYTDMVHVMVNNYGVVMNFMQGAGPNLQPLAIARIGMSKEHARSVLEVLQATLSQSDKVKQKHLPASEE